jgi:hypothetical protein
MLEIVVFHACKIICFCQPGAEDPSVVAGAGATIDCATDLYVLALVITFTNRNR